VNPGTTLNFAPASAATVSLSGTSAQTISANGALTVSANETVEIKNANGVALATDLTLPGASSSPRQS